MTRPGLPIERHRSNCTDDRIGMARVIFGARFFEIRPPRTHTYTRTRERERRRSIPRRCDAVERNALGEKTRVCRQWTGRAHVTCVGRPFSFRDRTKTLIRVDSLCFFLSLFVFFFFFLKHWVTLFSHYLLMYIQSLYIRKIHCTWRRESIYCWRNATNFKYEVTLYWSSTFKQGTCEI